MYQIISQIINHSWSTGSGEQQYIYYICGALICLFTVVVIDMVKDIFSALCRG